MKQALIVIDVQDSFRQRPFWDETEYPAFVAQIQRLIDAATSQSVPVLQVFPHQRVGRSSQPLRWRPGTSRR